MLLLHSSVVHGASIWRLIDQRGASLESRKSEVIRGDHPIYLAHSGGLNPQCSNHPCYTIIVLSWRSLWKTKSINSYNHKPNFLGLKALRILYVKDDEFKEAFELYANSVNGGFFRHEGFLFKEKRLCVSRIIRELLVKEAYEGDLMGHFGYIKLIRPCMSTFSGLT
ncbi:hypothetical protein CR513_24358, partial [Mucuna pruriens]